MNGQLRTAKQEMRIFFFKKKENSEEMQKAHK